MECCTNISKKTTCSRGCPLEICLHGIVLLIWTDLLYGKESVLFVQRIVR